MENAFHRLIPTVSIDFKPEIRKTWGKTKPSKVKTYSKCTYYFPSRFNDDEHAFYCVLYRLNMMIWNKQSNAKILLRKEEKKNSD